MNDLFYSSLQSQIHAWLSEDDLNRNSFYIKSLPNHLVELSLKIKSDLIISGADYFISTFEALGVKGEMFSQLAELEGKKISAGEVIVFKQSIPFSIALTAERLALNLLQHASSISTWTQLFVEKAQPFGIKILDTRKTTPGLRSIEKYAVRVGGGFNHRFGQTDLWMIKDNHKTCLGGLKGAFDFFKAQGVFYQEIVAEIHDLNEMKEAIDLGIRHLMLDNFSVEQIKEAIKMKPQGTTLEVSGGIRLSTLDQFLIEGIDAISIGALTYSAPRVDLSLKYRPV